MVAIGFWMYQLWSPRVPSIPEIDLVNIDPEIVDIVSKAQAEVRKAPRSEDAWGKLAMVLHGNGFRDQAFHCYAVAAELDNKDPRWPHLQAVILMAGNDSSLAIPYLEKAAELTSVNSLPRAKLADLLMNQGRFEEAATQFHKVLSVSPDEPHALFGLGQLAITRQQYKDALRYLDPVANHPNCRKRTAALRATAYERLGDQTAADNERQRMLELPDDAAWPDNRMDQVNRFYAGLLARLKQASHLAQRGQLDQTVDLLKSTVKAYPKSHTAWGFLGKGLGDLKDYAGAEQAFQKAIELAQPLDKAEHWYYLGGYRQEQRRFKEAADAFRNTVALRPLDAVAYFSLGECLEESGDRAGAAEAFRQALRHRPDMKSAQQRLAKLTQKS